MDMISIRRKLMAKIQNEPGILPDGYTQLKYIQANGHQYIDTDVYITDYTDIIKATFACTNGVQSDDYAIYGGVSSMWALGVGSWTRQPPYAQKPLTAKLSAGGSPSPSLPLVDLDVFVTVSANANTNTVTLDDTDYGYTGRWDRYAVTPALYQIFSHNSNTSGSSYLKLSYAEVANKGIFIPCIRDADGEVGIFNLITQNFMGNIGTGTLGYETMNGRYVAPV